MIESLKTSSFTSDEKYFIGQRLLIAASIKYLKTLETQFKLEPNTLIHKIDFSKHSNIILQGKVKSWKRVVKVHDKLIKINIVKRVESYKPYKNAMIAIPNKLSLIIPLAVHQELTQTLVKSEEKEHSTSCEITQIPFIMSLNCSSLALYTSSEIMKQK